MTIFEIRRWVRRVALGTAISLFAMTGAGQAQAQTNGASNERADHLNEADSLTVGGSGGNWKSEDPSVYQSGPITAMCICSGNLLDGIQVFYGGTAGKQYGSQGGHCTVMAMSRLQKITGVEVRHGNLVDAIAFGMDYDSPFHDYHNYKFGGDGGELTIKDPAGEQYLAYIEGSGGNAVDRLRFVFADKEYFSGFTRNDYINEYWGDKEIVHSGQRSLSKLIWGDRQRSAAVSGGRRQQCFKPEGSDQSKWLNDQFKYRCNLPFNTGNRCD